MRDISILHFRNPDVFIARQFHLYSKIWERIAALSSYDRADEVLDWIRNKVSLYTFSAKPLKGNFNGLSYNSDMPPRTEFDNNKSCNNFVHFIDKTLLQRVCSGAILVLGRVGEVDPSHLIMPLTVEPSKPRLCHDNRFLNLCIVGPFRRDNLSHLPSCLTKGSYQTTLDDKSDFDHILLDIPSRKFFGTKWIGWYFVSSSIPFGWKISADVYHSTGLLVSHFLWSIGIPCSLYIDERHNGELHF